MSDKTLADAYAEGFKAGRIYEIDSDRGVQHEADPINPYTGEPLPGLND